SGFVGELEVFLGFATSDAYSATFRVVIVTLAAVGVILSPIYLLSMLRTVFYGKEFCGKENGESAISLDLRDSNPREAFIALCLLIPIIGIGFYPKLATQTYDVKTVAVTAEVRSSLPLMAEQPFHFSLPFTAPVLGTEVKEFAGMVK
ncbi:MAG TPA: NAD(P)H-quinone oxidoreductase subunit 4, partial [Allocoleopsis sp.]